MERESTKHSPRMDDSIKEGTESLERGAPVESRVEEFREQEGSADGERVTDARLTDDGVEARSELAQHLRPSVFPAGKDALIAVARDEQAPGHVVSELRNLPDGERFTNVQEVWSALGRPEEQSDNRG